MAAAYHTRPDWRILVGEDAHVLDRLVRGDPENAYEPAFYDRMATTANWLLGGDRP